MHESIKDNPTAALAIVPIRDSFFSLLPNNPVIRKPINGIKGIKITKSYIIKNSILNSDKNLNSKITKDFFTKQRKKSKDLK